MTNVPADLDSEDWGQSDMHKKFLTAVKFSLYLTTGHACVFRCSFMVCRAERKSALT